MKTPREILLARHRAAEPKLDAIRATALAEANTNPAARRSGTHRPSAKPLAIGLMLWRELILPSRRIWSGLAATWILIALVNLAQSKSPVGVTAKAATRSEMAANYVAQQKMLGELLTDRTPTTDADRPKIFSPKPRTEVIGYRMV
jgi:hypothetical protein